MMYLLYLGMGILISLLLVRRLGLGAVYVLFAAAFTQNFVLPLLYTQQLIGLELARSLLLFKEFLLLILFVYSAFLLWKRLPKPWPRPLLILAAFTTYCVLRFCIGVVFLDDDWGEGIRLLRMVCFPVQVLTVALAAAWIRPKSTEICLNRICLSIVALGLVAVLMFFTLGPEFWATTVNIATYNIEVKGDDALFVDEELGVSATGLGRGAFAFLASLRAIGTFGDPLALGFALTAPILVFAFDFRGKRTHFVWLAILAAALFLTFSRSAWIFAFVGSAYLLYKHRKYALLALLISAPVILLLAVPPLAEFAAEEFSRFSWSSPGGEHAEGIIWLYQRGFSDLGNILGKGMSPSVRSIPESGYAFLLEHFGIAAYATFIWFFFSLFACAKRAERGTKSISTIVQAVVCGTLVVMHFAEYPFSFIGWLTIWFVLGFSLGYSGRVLAMGRARESLQPVRARG